MRAVESVSAATILPLRHAVLRPGQPPGASAYRQDDEPETLHLAAYDHADRLVGCATFFSEPLDGVPAWRLRGMATAPGARGSGHGGELLDRAFDELRRRGVTLLWCNARTPAVTFYQRHGFELRGAEFDIPRLGPHQVMIRRI